jgi:hypothetical protein
MSVAIFAGFIASMLVFLKARSLRFASLAHQSWILLFSVIGLCTAVYKFSARGVETDDK